MQSSLPPNDVPVGGPVRGPVHESRQFSLRSLFCFSIIVAVLLGVGVICGKTQSFRSLGSIWALVSLALMAGVWAAARYHLAGPRVSPYLSLALYGLSMCVPALRMGGDMVMGWQACSLSFLGVAMGWNRILADRVIDAELFWTTLACFQGALANLAFPLGHVALLVSRRRSRQPRIACNAGILGTLLALSVVLPLGFGTELDAIYPGYGLWAASFFALWLSARRNHAG